MGKARTGATISQEMVDRITEKAAAVAAERAVEMYQKQAAEEEKRCSESCGGKSRTDYRRSGDGGNRKG